MMRRKEPLARHDCVARGKKAIIPAEAGIQVFGIVIVPDSLDARFRGHDELPHGFHARRIDALNVQVKLFGIFCEFFPPGTKGPGFWLNVEEEAGLKDVISKLKIPEDLPKSIILNGRVAKEDQPLQEGDAIAIFTPITGG
jgi:molybdopterin converting factor small subunit